MVNKRFWLGIPLMVLVFGLVLVGCSSAPKPIGDPQNPRDELAGKTYVSSDFTIKTILTFNYDGTVTSKQILFGIIPKVLEPTPYSWDGTIGIITERVGGDSKFTLNSTLTEMIANGKVKLKLKK